MPLLKLEQYSESAWLLKDEMYFIAEPAEAEENLNEFSTP